ncbi:MAG TPA: alpha-L-rhamnosidase C-terminal domain-containing protein, partial [Amycolatopsis sp.]
ALTNGLLGVTPASPGFATFTVEPHPGPVAWARGQVPTPHGPITVSWQKTGSSITLTVTAPPGTHARIRLGDRQFTATPGTHSYRAAITAG